MLSIIVYGRNDAHGYNLPKRVALSLNGMADLLSAPDDEIVFVDYNTPDELPTFPETIADTLTDRALRRLRVIRVRPKHHAAVSRRTTRPVVEPIARNVGIRRAAPGNRWILSTNTDMLFLPRQEGEGFGDWLPDLEPALHHLPRFELPQTAWERLDRGRPAEVRAFLRRWGRPMRLHTALLMLDFVIYDAPGDFQLFPRADILRMDGFDEAMLLGWHVDSNLAKRFGLLRGRPRSLVDRLFGYHCDHAKLSDALHGHDHAEDDWRRFVEDVAEPGLPGQAERWGLAGIDLEEIRLPGASAEAFAGFVASQIAEEPPELDADDRLSVFDIRDYAPDSVIPYLADLLQSLPRTLSVGYAGISPPMADRFRSLWLAMGFTGGIRAHPASAGFLDAGMFVVEVGALPNPEADETALADLCDVLDAIVAAEAERTGRGLPPRRILVLNGQGNRMTGFIDGSVATPRTPSVTRLRQGFAKRRAALPEPLSPWFVMRHLQAHEGRIQGVPVTEAVRLLTDLDAIVAGTVAAGREGVVLGAASSLMALCGTEPARARYGEAAIPRAQAWIETRRASARLGYGIVLPVMEQPAPWSSAAPCRLATIEDWEDSDFIDAVRRRIRGRFAENRLKRCRTTWADIHTLLLLEREGLLTGTARILVVSGSRTDLPALLSRQAGRIDVQGSATGSGTVLRRPDRIRYVESKDGLLPPGSYDAVCFAFGTADGPGAADLESWLALATERLRPGGVAALALEVPLDRPMPGDGPRAEFLSGGDFRAMARARFGLERRGAAPSAISRDSLDMCIEEPGEGAPPPHFVLVRRGRPMTTGCWFLRKPGDSR